MPLVVLGSKTLGVLVWWFGCLVVSWWLVVASCALVLGLCWWRAAGIFLVIECWARD